MNKTIKMELEKKSKSINKLVGLIKYATQTQRLRTSNVRVSPPGTDTWAEVTLLDVTDTEVAGFWRRVEEGNKKKRFRLFIVNQK